MKKNTSLNLLNLTKWFDFKRVFCNLNANFTQGLNFLHGKNGAGKSTLISILSGSDLQFDGDIDYDGCFLRAEHSRYVTNVSYAPDAIDFFKLVSVKEFICFVRAHRQFRKDISLKQLSEEFGFDPESSFMLETLSLGNAKKLLLICALMIDANIYLFDEPLNGLDAQGKAAFINNLPKLENKIILIASHRGNDYPLENYKMFDIENMTGKVSVNNDVLNKADTNYG